MKMTRRDFLNVSTAAAVVCAATLLPVEKAAAAQQTLAAQNLLEQAYLYAFPLVIMDATRTASTNTRTATSNKAPINQDTQVLDPGLLPLFFLKFSQPFLAIGLGVSKPVYLFVVAVPDNAPFFHGKGRIFPDGRLYQSAQVLQSVQFLPDLSKKRALHLSQQIFDVREHGKRTFKCLQVSWVGRLDR